jgi:hypothetical protein
LEYRDAHQTLLLKGEFVGPKWKQVNVAVPEAYDEQTLDSIALALRNRGYEHLLFRFGEAQEIPESERNAALAELQSLGFQIEVSPDRRNCAPKPRSGYAQYVARRSQRESTANHAPGADCVRNTPPNRGP